MARTFSAEEVFGGGALANAGTSGVSGEELFRTGAPEGEGEDGEFVKGLKGGVDFAQGAGGSAVEIAGEKINSDYLRQKGAEIRERNTREAEQYQGAVPTLEDIPGKDVIDTLTRAGKWSAFQAGNLIPSMGTSVAGALAGGVVAGPIGAIGGGFAASTLLNAGEVNANLAELGVPLNERADTAVKYGAAGGALDSLLPIKAVGRLMRMGKGVPDPRRVARRVTGEAAKGAVIETATEGSQEALAIEAEKVHGFVPKSAEVLSRIANASAAGFLGGTMMGGASGLMPDKALPGASTPDEIEGALAGSEATGTGTKADPVKATSAEDIKNAPTTPAEPTPGQANAGNYQKVHMSLKGKLEGTEVAIENEKGSIRRDKNNVPPQWESPVYNDYGYIKGTEGADGDPLDIHVMDDLQSDNVYVVDQKNLETGEFDEHKVFAGAKSKAEAEAAYDRSFTDGKGPARRQDVTELTIDEWNEWKANGDHKSAIAGQMGEETESVTIPFELTEEWQDVPDGDILPGGAQVEANMETGGQRARLLPEDDGPPIPDDVVAPEETDELDTAALYKRAAQDFTKQGNVRNEAIDDTVEEIRAEQGEEAANIYDAEINGLVEKAAIESRAKETNDVVSQKDAVDETQAELESLRDQARTLIGDRDFDDLRALIEDEPFGESGREVIRRALDEAGFNPDRYMPKTPFSPTSNKTLSVEEMDGAIEGEQAEPDPLAMTDDEIEDNRIRLGETAQGIEVDLTDDEIAQIAAMTPADGDAAEAIQRHLDADADEILSEIEEPTNEVTDEGVPTESSTEAEEENSPVDETESAEDGDEFGEPVEEQDTAPVEEETPRAEGWVKLGVNENGHDVFEDHRGVRSVVQDGVRHTEPVQMSPDGSISVNRLSNERDRTYEPVEAEPEPGIPVTAKETERTDDAELQDDVLAGDVGESAQDDEGSTVDERTGEAPDGESAGDGAADPTDDGAKTDDGPGEGGEGSGLGADDGVSRDDDSLVAGENHRIEPGSLDETRGWKTKARDNLSAIRLVREIEAEGRPATKGEQSRIAKYVGWGGIANAFPNDKGEFGKGFDDIGTELRDLLTDTEYATARRSIQYAHYTSEAIVRSMWTGVERMGFKGGQVFEPGMGIGNFLGMAPDGVNIDYSGLELDHMTARIARLLYPNSGVRRDDFTEAPLPENQYDLVIGNPPFSDTVIKSDPKYAARGFMLHDYFFAKSLDSVRPGGLLAFITSAGTMNKISTDAREYLAERADLAGSIRLPGNAFEKNAGTAVTTDIIFLRKKVEGEELSAVDGIALPEQWVGTVERTLPNKEGVPTKGQVSKWFSDNPSLVIGEEGFFDRLYPGRYGVRWTEKFSYTKPLAVAIDSLPQNVMSERLNPHDTAVADFGTSERKEGSFYVGRDGNLLQMNEGIGREVPKRGKGVKGGKTAKDIEVIKSLIPIRDSLRAVYEADLAEDGENASKARKRLNEEYDAYIADNGPINTEVRSFRRPSIVEQEVARAEAREEARYAGTPFDEGTFNAIDIVQLAEDNLQKRPTMAQMARMRKDARENHTGTETWSEGTFDSEGMSDKVVVKRPNIDAFMDDPESYRIRAVEHYDSVTDEAKKSLVFTENVVSRDPEPQIDSVGDAVMHVMNTQGRFILSEVAAMAKKSEDAVTAELGEKIYMDPSSKEWVTAEEYLSGNVRKKLRIATAEADRNPAIKRNVSALEDSQPIPLPYTDIAASIGMPWIPESVVQQFGTEALGLDTVRAKYQSKIGQWFISGDMKSVAAVDTWGTKHMPATKLMQFAANRKDPKIFDQVMGENGKLKPVLNPELTQAAQDKLAEIKIKFREWIWEDDARRLELAESYNEKFNSLVVREYSGDYLTTPGISREWSWRPHQTSVVARIIQSGNTYMAHAVGAGKTSAMIGAGMEMKRLGLVNKPMYAVPNHMLGQFTKEFYEQYPTARIAVADDRAFHTSRRRQFMANAALSDLDAVIITHSSFKQIPISGSFEGEFIKEQIAEYREVLAMIPDDEDNRYTRKQVENRIEKFEQQLKGGGASKGDGVFTFEEMGVDFLFVDEAHLFRKLDFATTMQNIKGIDSNGSQASWDLYVKTRYLETIKPRRNLVFASGTAVTNTMAELFSVSRYMDTPMLRENGIESFDAWAASFGDTVTELEQNPAGGYKSVTRFGQFVNMPELSLIVRQTMDVVTSKQLGQYVTRPELEGGKREMVIAPSTPAIKAYQETLGNRMLAIENRGRPAAKGEDIILSVIGDGRKSAIDMRLVDAKLKGDPDSKLNMLVDSVFEIWESTKLQPFHEAGPDGYSVDPVDVGPATQMVFSGLGIHGKEFSTHKYIAAELHRRGVPKSEIALFGDYKRAVDKQRLFNDMNEGTKRVLIGSMSMATGVNAQRRLYASHNLDPLWFPAEDEQRNGRSLRQGNMNPFIRIRDYSTKGTYDSQMWHLMEKKARFIQQFFEGDPEMRNMEDLGEAGQYQQAKALSTSDERVMILTEAQQDLEKAERRKSAFARQQHGIQDRVSRAHRAIVRYDETIPKIEKDIEQSVDTAGAAFTGKIQGAAYDERVKFGERLLGEILRVIDLKQVVDDQVVGEIGGFPLAINTREYKEFGKKTTTFEGWATIIRNDDRSSDADSSSALGITQKLENIVSRLPEELADSIEDREQYKNEVEQFEPLLDKKFEGDAELAELRNKVWTLEEELEKGAAAVETPWQDALLGTDVDPDNAWRLAMSYSTGTGLTPAAEASWPDIRDRVNEIFETMAPEGTTLEIKDRLFGEGESLVRSGMETGDRAEIAGQYLYESDIIRVAMRADDPVESVRHEIIHALRKFFTPQEWALLEREAGAWKEHWGVEDLEEATAYEFGAFRRGETRKRLPVITRMFKKATQFLNRVANMMHGLGFQTYEDVFLSVESGEVSQRTPSDIEGGGRDSYSIGSMMASVAKMDSDHRVRGTDTQEAAMEHGMGQKETGFFEQVRRAVDWWKKRGVASMRQGFLDQWDAVKQLELNSLGSIPDAMASAYKAVRMTTNIHSVMASVLREGPLEVYTNDQGDKWFKTRKGFEGGFEAIFMDLAKAGTLHLWKGWAIANRANRLKGETGRDGKSRENRMSQEQIDELLKLGDQYPEFQQVLDRWMEFNRAMLDMAEQSGVINKEQRAVWEHADYVPFYRLLEDDTQSPNTGQSGGVEGQRSGVQYLTGRDEKVNDVLENMILNMTHLVDASMKNMAMQKVEALALDAGVMEKLGRAYKPALIPPAQIKEKIAEWMEIDPDDLDLSDVEMNSLVQMMQIAAPTGPDVVSVMREGKILYRRVTDPMLLRSLTSLHQSQLGGIMVAFRMAKRVLTESVTLDPAFMVANVLRDTMSAWVVSGQKGLIPGVDTVKGFKKAIMGSASLTSIMSAGGGSGGFYDITPGSVRKQLDEKLRGDSKMGLLNTGHKIWRFWHKIGAASEAANRIAVFDAIKKNGGTDAEAAYQALDLMDFSMRGDFAAMRVLIEMVPFMNARIQGLYRLGRGFNENRKMFLLRGSIIMGATMALMAANMDNDDYEALEEWDKDTYYHFFVGGEHFRLPKPFEVGVIFSTVPERFVRSIMGKDDLNTSGERLVRMFLDTFALDPTPQLVKPLLEQAANKIKFTGRPIVGLGLDRLTPEAQYDSNTSETARILGDVLPEWMGDAQSPKRIEALIRGYTGSLGLYALQGADALVRTFGDYPEKPSMRWDNMPVVKRFWRSNPAYSTKYSTQFYEQYNEINSLFSTIKEYRKRGDVDAATELLEDNRDKLRVRGMLNNAYKMLSSLNQRTRAIQVSDMSADEKRAAIDKVLQRKNDITKRVMTSTPVTGSLMNYLFDNPDVADAVKNAAGR